MKRLLKLLTQVAKKRLDPARVYNEAMYAQAARHEEMKRAAAGLLFARNKLEVELLELRADIGRTFSEIRAQVRAGNEGLALALMREKLRLAAQLERLEKELEEMRAQADEAKAQLLDSADELRNLERERLHTIATLSNARARKNVAQMTRVQMKYKESLESVRAEVLRVTNESHLERELASDPITRELGDGFGDDQARTELAMVRASLRRCA